MKPSYRNGVVGALVCIVAASLRMWSALAEGDRSNERRAITRSENTDGSLQVAGPWMRGHDPFRLNPHVPPPVEVALDAEPQRPEIDLTVLAVAGGSPWRAVMQSRLLQVPSRVVSVGDSIGPFIIEAISGQGVVVRGPDSSRVLPLARGGL